MCILYIDGSGSVQNSSERYFILGGVSIIERRIYHHIRDLDAYVGSLSCGPADDIELHASEIAAGRNKPWKGIPRKRRLEMIDGALDLLLNTHKHPPVCDRCRLTIPRAERSRRIRFPGNLQSLQPAVDSDLQPIIVAEGWCTAGPCCHGQVRHLGKCSTDPRGKTPSAGNALGQPSQHGWSSPVCGFAGVSPRATRRPCRLGSMAQVPATGYPIFRQDFLAIRCGTRCGPRPGPLHAES